ncbi:TonB-dependent receptor [Qipengyuania sp. 1XM1-15A]|uniref:TonB-dependent receptor n=1 Tax=Qipengyuania xiamenensis TaxID=2867237 RepID=UPI001C88466A|nr:TonB-dependent receptor [Qipengyuania xiamenensis]MBX7532518.1 TonB-dependent receptor [Qipengyuania xiamenensis]
MKFKYLLAASAVSLSATAAMVAAPAAAQQITSGIEGRVVDEAGAPVQGATVTVTDTRTGQSSVLTSGPDGTFRVGSLVPGGPYTVTAQADGYEGQSVEQQFITVSGNTSFTFELTQSADENVIVVTGARANVQQLAVGPGAAFGEATLEAFPSLSRDVRDIIRLDPRVSLERSDEVDRISCLGGNDRSNTFTVDGIVQADVFGLNGTPFAARNSLPLPYDVIRETSVEFAPFDVEYSDFTGCLVNVVTKSGQNEFHGSAFYTYYDDSMLADTIIRPDGEEVPLSSGSEERWGVTLGGPIIKDRLFFYAGYEETDLGDANDEGPLGGGFANPEFGVTQAQFDRFAQIARDVYGQDIGGYPRTLDETSVRYFGRIDAYINDDHRLEATYQRLEESNIEPDFGGGEITGLNSFEDEGTISDYYSVRLYSDWSDKVSTELRLSRAEVGDKQGPVGFGEAQSDNPTVRLSVGTIVPDATDPGEFNYGVLSTGPGIFRSANQLDTKIDQAKFQVNIDAGDHLFKIGAEANSLEVYNLFAINATGTLYFENLDDFENGVLSQGFEFFPNAFEIATGQAYGADINATPTGDINEAAATFNRNIYSFYAQDEWQATDQLSITAGLRVQIYDGDAPRANQSFYDRFGFTNANSFGKLDPVLLPRFSATYELDNDGFFSNSRITGGVGVFSGGDPVVYFSNAFSNNGFSTALGTSVFCASTPTNVLDAQGQFTGFPQCVTDSGSATAARGGGDVQSTDPDFDVPTVVRANLGFSTDFGTDTGFFSNWRLNLDYIYSRFNDTLNFVDLVQAPNPDEGNNGYTIDGRPIYDALDINNAGCNATLVGTGGTPPVYDNLTGDCFGTRLDDFIQLTNGPSYESHIASALLSKRFDGGLITDGGSVNLRFGYAFTDSENNRDVGSSTATSSFDRSAAFDRQNPAVSTSNYETRHNFTAAISFREEFFGDYATQLGLYFRARSGRPYSLVFDGGSVFNDSASGSDNALLYVPSGINDPNLSPFSDATAVQELIDYVAASGCEYTPGASIERNTCRNPWSYDLDMRISQELPFFGKLTGLVDDRLEIFADFDNVLNMIDAEANRVIFNFDIPTSFADYDDEGRYIIDNFNPDDDQSISISGSAWKIQVGARYEF